MQPRLEIAVYSQTSIQTWNESRLNDGEQKKSILSRIEKANALILTLHETLDPQREKVHQLNIEINKLQEQMADEQHHHMEAHHDGGIPDLWTHIAMAFDDRKKRIEDLRKTRDGIEKFKKSDEDLLSVWQTEKEKLDKEKKQLEENEKELTTLIQEASTFLDNFTNHPEVVFAALKNQIIQKLSTYYQNYPHHSTRVRLCLHEFKKKLDLIATHEGSIGTTNIFRENYLLLCGWLWSMFDKFWQDRENLMNDELAFFNVLKNLLQQTHVAENGDLPDKLATGQPYTKHFESFASQALKDFPTNEDDLLAKEEQNYNNAYDALSKLHLVDNPTLSQLTKELAEAIKEQKTQEREKFDYAFYTRILTSANTLTQNPNDATALAEFQKLATQVPGQSSVSKKILGIMLAIAGVVVIGLSISAAIGTFGGSSVLSLMGIAIGTSIIAKSLTLTVGGVMLATTFGGCTLFHKGREKGVCKKMHAFERALPPSPK